MYTSHSVTVAVAGGEAEVEVVGQAGMEEVVVEVAERSEAAVIKDTMTTTIEIKTIAIMRVAFNELWSFEDLFSYLGVFTNCNRIS